MRIPNFFVSIFCICALIISGCTKTDIPLNSSIEFNSDDKTILFNGRDVGLVGKYHNEILHIVASNNILPNYSETTLKNFEYFLDSLIESTPSYRKTFTTGQKYNSALKDIYIEKLRISKIQNKTEFKEKLIGYFNSELLESSKKIGMSDEEVKFLETFLKNAFSSSEKIDVLPYYNELMQKNLSFIKDGAFTLSLLVIYDYSSDFWLDQYSQYSTKVSAYKTEDRIVPWLIGVALTDVAGAWSGGVANIIRNGANHYNPDDDIFESMGRGAVGASSGGLGPLAEELIF